MSSPDGNPALRRVVAGLAYGGVTILFLVTSRYWVDLYDEGVILTGAQRVLAGDVPSRDFFANYGPAQFWILALAFKLGGMTVLVARLYDAAVSALLVGLAYAWLARTHPRWLALCCAACVGGLLLEFRSACSPIQICMLICLAGVIRLSDALAEDTHRWALLPVSLALGLLLLFRYDIAPLVTTAFALPMLLVEASRVRGAGLQAGQAVRRFCQDVLILLTAPLLAVVLLDALGIFGPALAGLRAYSGENYVAMRSLPWPGLARFSLAPFDTAAVYAPPVAALCGLYTILRARRAGGSLHTDSGLIAIVVLTVVTACFFSKGFVRTSGAQMLFANVPATVLVFACLPRLTSLGTRYRRALSGLTALFVAWILVRNGLHADPLYRHLGGPGVESDLPALSCFGLQEDRRRAAVAIVELTRPDERIHSATGRHDKVVAGDVLIYFVTRRLPATRWHHHEPGVQTTAVVQRQIIRELEQARVGLVMVDATFDGIVEPNLSARSSGVELLDDYLTATFRPERRFGAILLLVRQDRGRGRGTSGT